MVLLHRSTTRTAALVVSIDEPLLPSLSHAKQALMRHISDAPVSSNSWTTWPHGPKEWFSAY
jgi:hypothetical protein